MSICIDTISSDPQTSHGAIRIPPSFRGAGYRSGGHKQWKEIRAKEEKFGGET
jgi:hypothetical protein